MTFSVLHVLPSLDPRRGGPVSAVTELVAGLTAAGIPSAIAVPAAETRWPCRAQLVGCGTWPVPRGPLVRLPQRSPLPSPVVTHVHGLSSFVPWSPFVRTPRRGPVVGTLHGILDWRSKAGSSALQRRFQSRFDVPLLRRLDGIHVTRDSEVVSARPLLAGGRDPVVLPWALAGSTKVTDRPSVPRRPYFLCVGRLHPIKGLERAFEAFARVAAGTGARLLLAGTGARSYVRTLERSAGSLAIRDRIEFLGLLAPESLGTHYAEAAALLLPSRYENFGMVVLEALREGTPVLAARETPWAELEARGSGRYLDFDDPVATAAAMTLALSPDWRGRTFPRARAHAAEFAPERVVPRFAAWYEDVVRRTPSLP